MRGVFLAVLLTQLWGAFSTDSCELDVLNAALQEEGPDASVELVQLKSSETQGETQEAESGEEWYHRNPVGWRGGPGHGYVHHNPPGIRGGWGHGTTYVHHNPPGRRGGWGHGHTYYHHRGYGWGHGSTVYHHHGWR